MGQKIKELITRMCTNGFDRVHDASLLALDHHGRRRLGFDMKELLTTMDAAVWAREFCKVAKRLGVVQLMHSKIYSIDEGWMLGWFANAIMTGYDEALRRAAKDPSLLPKPPKPPEKSRFPYTALVTAEEARKFGFTETPDYVLEVELTFSAPGQCELTNWARTLPQGGGGVSTSAPVNATGGSGHTQ